jgi:hypothetical protein
VYEFRYLHAAADVVASTQTFYGVALSSRCLQVLGAIAIGVLTGVYIFDPAARAAGRDLRAQQAGQPSDPAAPQPVVPPSLPPPTTKPRSSWRD